MACYDKVATGEEIVVGREKVPLDLVETVKASFTDLRPTAVFATEGNEASEGDPELAAEVEDNTSPGAK